MVDCNYELRTSYFSLLAGNIIINGSAIPVYYSQVPNIAAPTNPDNYLLLTSIYSTNYNDDDTTYLTCIVQFTIVTKQQQNNAGAIKDSIASQLYSFIWPSVKAQPVQIVSGQVFDTKIQTDVEQTSLSDGEKKVINRLISLRHLIAIADTVPPPPTGYIYYGVQDTNADPVDFSHVLSQNGNFPISCDYGAQSDPKFYWMACPVVFTTKGHWQDLHDLNNSGTIGGATDLFVTRTLIIGSDVYVLYMTQYVTGFNPPTSQVRYY